MRNRAGYTLLELSIVLVIIGLLVGGVVAGKSLIRSAEVNNLMSDLQTIDTSVQAFRDQYHALPGDFAGATQIWGIQAGATGNDDTCYLSASTDKKTCNGNDDGWIHTGYTTTGRAERGRAWQHLANAGLVSGQYSGVMGPAATEWRIGGVNTMAGPFSSTHFNFAVEGTMAGAPWYFPFAASTNFVELSTDADVGESPDRNILTTVEMFDIDSKIDDGKPALGRIRGPSQNHPLATNCTVGTTSTATYNLSKTSKTCYLLYLLN